MLKKKQIILILGLTLVFVLLLISFNMFQEKPKPIIAHPLAVTASVDVEGDQHISDNLINVNYKWVVGPNWAPPTGSPVIFVHLQDEDGERLCQDDHPAPVQIKEWLPNQTYEYQRKMYIPITLLKKKVYLLVGIYNSDNTSEYFSIQGLQQFSRFHRYLAKEFVLIPSDMEYSEAIIKYTRGWYDPEVDKRGNVKWRWMKNRGECQLLNPKSDAFLFINAWIPNKHFEKPATVSLVLAGKQLELPAPGNDMIHTTLELTAEQLGDAEYITFEIETDQTFIPAQKGSSVDARELGVMVKKILFRAQ